MADNVTLDAGSGGAVIKTDDDGTAHWQYVKVAFGADNTQTRVDSSTGLPVSDAGGSLTVDDGGGSLTVDGTVAVSGTVAVTDNSGSLTVDNPALSVTGGGAESSALRVTIANDSTGVVSVDDNGGTISIDDGGGAITVDGTVAVSGTVTVDSELTTADLDTGAGTDTRAVVGLAGTASGGAQLIPGSSTDGLLVNLGSNNDVTVTGTVTADLSATDNAVLDDIAAKLATIDADTSALAGAVSGAEVQVDVVAALPTGANTIGSIASIGTSVVPGTAATNLGKAEDAAHATGDVGVMALAVRTDTPAARAGTDGDYIPLTTDSTGRLHVAPVSVSNASGASAVNIQDGGNSITVDGTVTANAGSGPWPVTDNGGSLTVDNGGTFAVQAAQSGTWNVDAVTTLTGGGVAHDAADSGNPHKIGAKAGTSDQTAVANNDRTDLRADVLGHQVVRPYALHENLVSGATAAITNTTSTSVLAAAGAGVRNYVTSLLVTNSHATVGTLVTVTDGSGGSTLYRGYAAPVGGGYSLSFPTPLRGSANTAVHAVCGTTGSNTYVSASGYTAAV